MVPCACWSGSFFLNHYRILYLIPFLWYVCLRIAGLTTTALLVLFPCHWLMSLLCKCCETVSLKHVVCLSSQCFYAKLMFFSQYLLLNVGICLITVSQVWFLIMAPSHYSLPSGILLCFEIFLLSVIWPANDFWMDCPSCSFTNNLDLCGPVTGHPCPGSPPFSPPPPFVPPSPISGPGSLYCAFEALKFGLHCYLLLYHNFYSCCS